MKQTSPTEYVSDLLIGYAMADPEAGTGAQVAAAAEYAGGIKDAATLSNIAKANNPLKAAKKGAQRKAVMTGAIASGVDPVAAKGLGYVKKIPTAVKKSKAGIAAAKAGGDVASQIAVMSGKKPIQKAKKSIPGITQAVADNEALAARNRLNDSIRNSDPGSEIVGGRAFGESGVIKEKGSSFRRKKRGRRGANPQSAGGSSLKVNLNAGTAAGGINP